MVTVVSDMIWIAAERPTAGGLAVLWLVVRFIDTRPRFAFVAADAVDVVADATGGWALHADWRNEPGQPLGDQVEARQTFQSLVARHRLGGDRALIEVASLARAADQASVPTPHPLGEAVRAIGRGALTVEGDDHWLVACGTFLYDAVYAYYRRSMVSREPPASSPAGGQSSARLPTGPDHWPLARLVPRRSATVRRWIRA